MRTATETRENDSGGAVKIWDNGYVRQGQRLIQRQTSTVAEIKDNRDGYVGGGDAGRQ